MATPTASLPRRLLPRSQYVLRTRLRLLPPVPSQAVRHASSKAPPQNSKTNILEKPDKFRPPSHGRKLPKRNTTLGKEYGPRLTEADRIRMRTKKYPNMMAPEGTRMYWFLHSKAVHVGITLSILVSLCAGVLWVNFHTTTPYRDLLPERSDLWRHPISSLSQFFEVYKMHTAYTSAQTAEKRKKKVEDVKKRAEYRKAHGLDKEEGFGGWTAKSDAETLGPGIKMGDVGEVAPAGAVVSEAQAQGQQSVEDDPRYYIGADGVRRRRVKKWFGIWE